ncbi:hypothetical protein [Pseudohalioglobus lutimaris]|uniref:Uncharacterized protein n=1 Tax=Pseudohalioglobus lutimaris TaxID=1737061 RepID=A0A2N5WXI0_9GAMM|nr:hypothetical protein [Pseudohalioglobus lutimaris]PLW66952.1 hypothetical protein C0039_19275 [Pseudohalioglobus lutimaris]
MLFPRLLNVGAGMALLLAMTTASAESLESAANDLCEKVKACSLAELNQQELTPELKAMMEPILEGMCAAMSEGIQEVPVEHELYASAVACMRSMANLSCADFRDGSRVETPECLSYREKAEKIYNGS